MNGLSACVTSSRKLSRWLPVARDEPSRLLKKPVLAQAAQEGPDVPRLRGTARKGRGTHRRWVKAYFRYAAASARAGGVPVRRMGPRRWAFFNSLLG